MEILNHEYCICLSQAEWARPPSTTPKGGLSSNDPSYNEISSTSNRPWTWTTRPFPTEYTTTTRWTTRPPTTEYTTTTRRTTVSYSTPSTRLPDTEINRPSLDADSDYDCTIGEYIPHNDCDKVSFGS